jgi:hypothetical protein
MTMEAVDGSGAVLQAMAGTTVGVGTGVRGQAAVPICIRGPLPTVKCP